MKKTLLQTGHRWTDGELREFMTMWANNCSLEEMSLRFTMTKRAVCKQVTRLRAAGVPLAYRKNGHVAGRTNKPWTQSEVEYVIRRRKELASCEVIADELQRTYNAVNAMIQTLRKESVDVPMRGSGARRLWCPEILKANMIGFIEQGEVGAFV